MTILICILLFLWCIEILILFYVLKSFKANKGIKVLLLELENLKLNNCVDDKEYVANKNDLLSQLESYKLLLFGIFTFIVYFFPLLFLSFLCYISF